VSEPDDFNKTPDDFDKDITGDAEDEVSNFGTMVFAFSELHEGFTCLREAGFTENQALKFLAFCSIYEGDFS